MGTLGQEGINAFVTGSLVAKPRLRLSSPKDDR